MDKDLLHNIKLLLLIFKGFINYNFELILVEETNIYIDLKLLKNKKDLLKNIFEWKSRDCSAFDDKETNEFRSKINKFLRKSINREFSKDDFDYIYRKIGRGGGKLTEEFINNGFDLSILKNNENLDKEIESVLLKPINFDVPIVNHQNANIVFGGVSEEKILELGFRNNVDNYYFCKSIVGKNEITFNLTIYKKDKRIKIDILDENFLQPYDYQKILLTYGEWKNVNKNQYPFRTHLEVQKLMKWLLENKIIEGYNLGDYI